MISRRQAIAVVCAVLVLASGAVAGVVVPGTTATPASAADASTGDGGSSLLQNASRNESTDGSETPSEGDTEAATDDDSADSDGGTAYQLDVAVGEVITDLGSDENAFYARENRLLQAQTVRADGAVTGSFHTLASPQTVEGCEVAYDPVSYDSGEVTVEVSVDGCEHATLTLAVYELPGDTVEFRRDRADEQELVAHRTATVDSGETATLSVTVDGPNEVGGASQAEPSNANANADAGSAGDSKPEDATEAPTETPEATPTETTDSEKEEPSETGSTPTDPETETEAAEETPTETETPEAADGSADLSISDVNKEVQGNERENLERETVTITNDGDAAVDLSGYTLVYGTGDERRQTYTFDEGFTLDADESVTVHTGEGTDTETDVYLGSGNPVLNNEESERLVLRDDGGDTVAETTT